MRRLYAALTWALVVGGVTGYAAACLWDRDPLAAEAAGLPDVVDIIVGRFERNPPLYYEMRLARVTKEIESNPGDLRLYDDAGVACDRLGRHDEAMAWMERKKAQLDKLDAADPATKDHTYRYLANLGTFYAHRWFSLGADRSDMEDLKRGRDLIAQAIELNPDAHFGREKFQLMTMEWVLEPPDLNGGDSIELPSIVRDQLLARDSGVLVGSSDNRKLLNPAHAVRGFAGLVALGNAWQSVDIYYALHASLAHDEQASLAHLAGLRTEELVMAGRRSMHPRAASGHELVQQLWLHPMIRDWRKPDQRRLYEIARHEADRWHEERTTFMVARLDAGRHPDTDPSFWDGYHERPRPELVESGTRQTAAQIWRIVSSPLGLQVASVLLVLILVNRLRVRHRKRRRLAAQGTMGV